jgi:hypothetical protein
MNPVHNPPPISLRYILILSSYLRLCLPNCLSLLEVFLQDVCMHSSSLACVLHALPTYPPCLHNLNNIESNDTSLCSLIPPLIISSLWGPNVLLSTLLSNTPSQFSSLNVRGQVPRPDNLTGRTTVLSFVKYPVNKQRARDKRYTHRLKHLATT